MTMLKYVMELLTDHCHLYKSGLADNFTNASVMGLMEYLKLIK